MTKITCVEFIYPVREGSTSSTFVKVGDAYGCHLIERIDNDIFIHCKGKPVVVAPIGNVKYYIPIEDEKKDKVKK